ncbi:hypothetical protein MJT46_008623 [Ovis ammon polii x Ovis aries]|nr:hypothetical protein MJT46_008623 [Ovis ammon polii x Ovis aries]
MLLNWEAVNGLSQCFSVCGYASPTNESPSGRVKKKRDEERVTGLSSSSEVCCQLVRMTSSSPHLLELSSYFHDIRFLLTGQEPKAFSLDMYEIDQGTQIRFLVWEDSICCGATKPTCHNHWALESVLCNKRSHGNEKPKHYNQKVAPACCN